MHERIRRIVGQGRGDHRVWGRCTLGAGVLAAVIAVSAAIAQPRDAPAARPEQVQRQERPDQPDPAAVAGRRNVLNRMLEQLRNQVRQTEQALAERPEATGERALVLQSERQALQEQIERIETQLRNLDRGRRGPQTEAQVARQQAGPQAQRLQELRERAGEIQGQLQGIEDKEGDQARALREELNGVRAQITAAELQVQESRRIQAERPLRTPVRDGASPAGGRVTPESVRGLDTQVAELRAQVEGLRQKVDRMEQALDQILRRRPAGEGYPTLPPQF
ncbi:MAG: hypothetical protein KBE04_14885 [Phycisphaerae bacterium]|nr:hypothetical protein [Phycisphaerae bacterium]